MFSVLRPPECNNDTDIRLAGGANNMLGRVEICLEGRWAQFVMTRGMLQMLQLSVPSLDFLQKVSYSVKQLLINIKLRSVR